jgi:predicted helicase
MRHMLEEVGKNLGLVSARSNKSADVDHFFCSRTITETKCGESTTQSCLLPLYLYPAEGEMHFGDRGGHTNLDPVFTMSLSQALGIRFVEHGPKDIRNGFGPEDVFYYVYSVFHSPRYRERYAEYLRRDFARLPICPNRDVFRSLVDRGAELTALHLMESPLLADLITKYPVSGSNAVEKVSYAEANQRVHINSTQCFEGVPPKVWEFHIGGYQVAQKWLKDRKGRTLTYDDLVQYQRIIVALNETIRIMREIDEVIDEHGGWPDAFQHQGAAEPSG